MASRSGGIQYLMCPIIDELIVVVMMRAKDDTDMYMKENIKRWFLLTCIIFMH